MIRASAANALAVPPITLADATERAGSRASDGAGRDADVFELEAIVQELEATTAAECDKMDQDEVRQKMRAMKNRLSAKMSRQRALIYVRGLEKSFSDLMARHQALARDFDVVNFERERLHYEKDLVS